eukprot:GHVH01011016.1.p1 GENE.GHVH01011016.1~~GHVH01011016.1.p1  ORF type:complete len:487 (+),score=47.50 GHVH01011016.1:59-1519(+)
MFLRECNGRPAADVRLGLLKSTASVSPLGAPEQAKNGQGHAKNGAQDGQGQDDQEGQGQDNNGAQEGQGQDNPEQAEKGAQKKVLRRAGRQQKKESITPEQQEVMNKSLGIRTIYKAYADFGNEKKKKVEHLLSCTLRFWSVEFYQCVEEGGFIPVEELIDFIATGLCYQTFLDQEKECSLTYEHKYRFCEIDNKSIVDLARADKKGRFAVKVEDSEGVLVGKNIPENCKITKIAATQGWKFDKKIETSIVQDKEALRPCSDVKAFLDNCIWLDNVPVVGHITSKVNLPTVFTHGLNAGSRSHVHFGMRCQPYQYAKNDHFLCGKEYSSVGEESVGPGDDSFASAMRKPSLDLNMIFLFDATHEYFKKARNNVIMARRSEDERFLKLEKEDGYIGWLDLQNGQVHPPGCKGLGCHCEIDIPTVSKEHSVLSAKDVKHDNWFTQAFLKEKQKTADEGMDQWKWLDLYRNEAPKKPTYQKPAIKTCPF